ncbi:MAG: hypothetical protein ACM65M_11215 [Microcoleus sp.]
MVTLVLAVSMCQCQQCNSLAWDRDTPKKSEITDKTEGGEFMTPDSALGQLA